MDTIMMSVEEKMETGLEFLKKEFRSIRTGRATTALVDHIKVEYYGTPTELRQLATVSVQEATTLLIKPFDPSCIKEIEKAILASELGITPQGDGKVVRLQVPPLSIERRDQLAIQVKKMSEAARVTVRNARRDGNKEIDAKQKEGDLTEDDSRRGKDDIQKLTDRYEKSVTAVVDAKISEIQDS
ncbi:MAG: ribosome recycling factor [Phycisphaerales bacterium]|jgi:ribosome recycling factor|nr:ribosome recycling factor [Phycisphaerales bacterium]MBT7171925.1 ribosome recycling factor [Phycisphaerales bacterium]